MNAGSANSSVAVRPATCQVRRASEARSCSNIDVSCRRNAARCATSTAWSKPLRIGGTLSSSLPFRPTELKYNPTRLSTERSFASSAGCENQPGRIETSTSAGRHTLPVGLPCCSAADDSRSVGARVRERRSGRPSTNWGRRPCRSRCRTNARRARRRRTSPRLAAAGERVRRPAANRMSVAFRSALRHSRRRTTPRRSIRSG